MSVWNKLACKPADGPLVIKKERRADDSSSDDDDDDDTPKVGASMEVLNDDGTTTELKAKKSKVLEALETPDQLWPDKKQRDEFVTTTTIGADEYGTIQRYTIDTKEPADALALLNDMNEANVDEWARVYDADGGDDAPRFFTAFPVRVPEPAQKVERVVVEFSTLYGLTGMDFLATKGRVEEDAPSFGDKGTIQVPLDHRVVARHLPQSCDASQLYHVVPLQVRLLAARNSSQIDMRVKLEGLNTRTEASAHYAPYATPVGLCNPTDVQLREMNTHGTDAGQLYATIPAHANASQTQTMYRFDGTHLTSPEAQRWMQVDVGAALREAMVEHASSDKGDFFRTEEPDVATSDGRHRLLFPDTIFRAVLFGYGKVLRRACEVMEVALPERRVGKKHGTVRWWVHKGAFEMALRFLCQQAPAGEVALNLAAPLRIALSPRSGQAAYSHLAATKVPIEFGATLELTYVTSGVPAIRVDDVMRARIAQAQTYHAALLHLHLEAAKKRAIEALDAPKALY